jgi:ABC-type phosphate transport system ATPase subunit
VEQALRTTHAWDYDTAAWGRFMARAPAVLLARALAVTEVPLMDEPLADLTRCTRTDPPLSTHRHKQTVVSVLHEISSRAARR